MAAKQVYIPKINLTGTYIEELGTATDKICYPGSTFSVEICLEDFEDKEEYHTAWIAITKAAQKKLEKKNS